MTRFAVFGLGVLAVIVSTVVAAVASTVTPVAAPEIDGTSLTAGLGLLAAGVMIVRARAGRK